MSSLTRRDAIRLLGLGLGAAALPSSAAAAAPGGFRFIVVNDVHCRDERCHPWMRKIVASMKRHQPAFCLVNGDLCENGTVEQLTAVRQIFTGLGVPLYATLGNHDYFGNNGHAPFNSIFPNSLNYHFEHQGWQFVGLDSTDGRKVFLTMVQRSTLAWLDANLPKLDRAKPTVVCTHFPLGDGVLCRPINAGEILSRFDGFNLRGTFSGHWHGYAERHFEHAEVINSRCSSWWRQNNDGSP
ncbi:MAG TPA: metallophosphoesterase, partial [Chthoniobacteraceae bacterium]|nr:metallophosphoesterase [Chthoniobacteraceae bacterium]